MNMLRAFIRQVDATTAAGLVPAAEGYLLAHTARDIVAQLCTGEDPGSPGSGVRYMNAPL